MLTSVAQRDSRPSLLSSPSSPSFWPRVREFAVPASMIETATARRLAGDWAGACAAAGVDVDLRLRSVFRTHGRESADRIRADLRRLAPDLLRWHLPRIAPNGLLRPGLTIVLARYDTPERDGPGGPLHLVVRTPPAWADAGQRVSLALWDGSHAEPGARRHPHPHPNRRFRLDLHRHLWDATRADELRSRSGADRPAAAEGAVGPVGVDPGVLAALPPGRPYAVDRWAEEAAILLRAEGPGEGGAVSVRLGGRRRLLLYVIGGGGEGPNSAADAGPLSVGPHPRTSAVRVVVAEPGCGRGPAAVPPVLPDAATWVLPDLELIRTGAIGVEQLHPLVARALVPDGLSAGPGARRSRATERAGQPRFVECRGPGTGSGWSTGCCPRSTTTPPRSAGKNSWSPSPVRLCPASRPSTRRTGVPTVWPGSGNAWTTGTSPERWPSSKGCSGPRRCCAAVRCGTSWSRPPNAASPTGCSGRTCSTPAREATSSTIVARAIAVRATVGRALTPCAEPASAPPWRALSRCLLSIARCPLPVARCPLPVDRCLVLASAP